MPIKKTKHSLRRYIIAGLLVLVPLWVTFVVIESLVKLFDNLMLLLPKTYRPDILLGVHLPGLSFIITLCVVVLTGMVVTNFLGRRLVFMGEALLAKIPLVSSIYSAVKQKRDGYCHPSLSISLFFCKIIRSQ